MPAVQDLLADLAAEHEALDAVVRDLDPPSWELPTPADGWAIRDQIGHLWFFDGTAVLAATDAEAFARSTERLLADAAGGDDPSVAAGRLLAPDELLARWRAGRAALLEAFAGLDPRQRLPWYGPPMSAMSFVTARLMETWAHGQDVRDALGLPPEVSDRLRHIAHIGVRARPFSYTVHRREMPAVEIRVELVPPGGGSPWTWGPEGVPDVVRGDAVDFCLVVTQRRHVDDTDLVVEGPAAREWISIAQAFAGGAGTGRRPGQFRDRGSA